MTRTASGREEGETLHYALYTVFARSGARPAESNTDEARAEFEKVAEQLAADGVTLRGIYDSPQCATTQTS